MSDFKCTVERLVIEPHPNADALEIARVGDYMAIVPKNQFKTGSLGVYIPEQAIVPDWMIKAMGLEGRLSGSAKNRVKAIKLRGVLSQGLVWPVDRIGDHAYVSTSPTENDPVGSMKLVTVGEDLAETFGIKKWEPMLPAHMAGRMVKPKGEDLEILIKYDFENLKRVPDLFEEHFDVVVTEKIHGTFVQIGWLPESMKDERFFEGRGYVSSKGLGARGFILDHNDESNLYVQVAKTIWPKLNLVFGSAVCPVLILGEIYGQGVQDLTYGESKPTFRAFEIYIGTRSNGFYLERPALENFCKVMNVQTVPKLYEGRYSKQIILKCTDGQTIAGSNSQIREGVVVTALRVGAHPRHGRRIAKSVSEAYLLRKGEATEFQ